MNNSKPKDLKRSIRDKYKRRLTWLADAVEQFEYAANDRLENGGNIRDREHIEELLLALSYLKPLLPDDNGIDEDVSLRICEIFGIEHTPTNKNKKQVNGHRTIQLG